MDFFQVTFFPIVLLKNIFLLKKKKIWDPKGLTKSHLLKPIRSPDRNRTHTQWGMSARWASRATCCEEPPSSAVHRSSAAKPGPAVSRLPKRNSNLQVSAHGTHAVHVPRSRVCVLSLLEQHLVRATALSPARSFPSGPTCKDHS